MPDTAITLEFGPGRYRFWLPMARIIEIERACGDKSVIAIYEEMSAGIGIRQEDENAVFRGIGTARIKDVYEVIRCAAIGGGEADIAGETVAVSPTDATRLVNEYVDGRPLSETVPVAWVILHSAVMGVQLKKKADGETENESPSEKAAS